MKAASRWGVRMRINFAALDHLEVYGRGNVIGQRMIRNWKNFLRVESISVPLYQRVVVVFRTNAKLKSPQFDSRRVYLRMFKNVPQQDVDMLLPSIDIRDDLARPLADRGPQSVCRRYHALAFPAQRAIVDFVRSFQDGAAMVVLGLFAIGFGIKSMLTYRTYQATPHAQYGSELVLPKFG
ncbi:MAG: DUF3754 domain-containing protein [Pirellulaceae bacterium]